MKLIAENNGIEVFSAGNEIDSLIKRGSQVQVSTATATKLRDSMVRRRQGDACETIYNSEVKQQSCLGPMVSMADYFPIDRRSGMATSIKMSMSRQNQPIMPQIVCCPTDIPLISPNQGKKCDIFTGFANIVVGFDTCLFEQMRCDEQGQTLDDEYLPMVIESLNMGANYIALNGDDDANVIGLRNNTYIPTELVAPPSGTNIAVELRRIVNSFVNRRNQIVDVSSGAYRQTYTLFLASNIVSALANTWITMQSQQFSMLSILTGDCGLCQTDPSIPKFRIISIDALNAAYFDGSDMGYIFSGNVDNLGSVARWHKPYSLIALPPATIGLREQKYFAARVGSIEFYDLCSVTRLIIPTACSRPGENINPYVLQ